MHFIDFSDTHYFNALIEWPRAFFSNRLISKNACYHLSVSFTGSYPVLSVFPVPESKLRVEVSCLDYHVSVPVLDFLESPETLPEAFVSSTVSLPPLTSSLGSSLKSSNSDVPLHDFRFSEV